ncbi:hypothetical protein Q4503_12780 [Colwellia sp. 6_MG-2023]|uniref:hypothetical protein n=1 Tax=Colwellia sp. 6_MG-2023 TaxID=3062676 RepID=UPI0026E34133|nr:hypothetical protein [Colwellia sp. 6_MG-2023]MDO6488582.1 hypothetical protein [Colwellia sp. 6_MG-2023]
MDKLPSIFNIMDEIYPKHLRQINDTLRQLGIHQNPYDDVIRNYVSPYNELERSLGLWQDQFGISSQVKQLQDSLKNLYSLDFPTIEESITNVVELSNLDSYLKAPQPTSATVQQALGIQRNLSLIGYLNEYDLFNQLSLPRSPVESLMKEISSMQSGSLQSLISSFSGFADEYEDFDDLDDELNNLDEDESEGLVNQAITVVNNSNDFSTLSPKVKTVLYKVLISLLKITSGAVIGLILQNQWESYEDSSKPKISQMQSIFPTECLNRCRNINRNNAKLYSDHSRKSEIIFEPEKNTMLYVLDKEGKSWLKVQVKEVETDTVHIGWLMNSYTNRIRF